MASRFYVSEHDNTLWLTRGNNSTIEDIFEKYSLPVKKIMICQDVILTNDEFNRLISVCEEFIGSFDRNTQYSIIHAESRTLTLHIYQKYPIYIYGSIHYLHIEGCEQATVECDYIHKLNMRNSTLSLKCTPYDINMDDSNYLGQPKKYISRVNFGRGGLDH